MNYKCGDCGEVVLKADKEHHDSENHTSITCTCGEFSTMGKQQMESHKANDCKLREKECTYCPTKLPAGEIEQHIKYCGSKTFLC